MKPWWLEKSHISLCSVHLVCVYIYSKDNDGVFKLERWTGIIQEYRSGNCYWLLVQFGSEIMSSTMFDIPKENAGLSETKS